MSIKRVPALWAFQRDVAGVNTFLSLVDGFRIKENILATSGLMLATVKCFTAKGNEVIGLNIGDNAGNGS